MTELKFIGHKWNENESLIRNVERLIDEVLIRET